MRKLFYTKKLLKELQVRDENSKFGIPIPTFTFNRTYDEINKIERNLILYKFLFYIISILFILTLIF